MSTFFTGLCNVIVIQLSIVAFVAPFYILYRRRAYGENPVRTDFNRHLENFLISKESNYLFFFWAMAEAIIWFVIPEFLLLLVVFVRVKKRLNLLTYDIYGTIAGTVFALTLGVSREGLLSMPYVQENMVRQAEIWFQNLGTWALLFQPFSGVPFKVFNHSASQFDVLIPAYILFAVVVRVGRYAIFYFILNGLYSVLHTFVYQHYLRLFIIATAVFALLLYEVYTSFGPGYIINAGL